MNEEIKQLNEDSRIQDKLREAYIKQMEIGYQEMAKINLGIANEWCSIENEAEAINEGIWKQK
ncbi:hypothetical protein [Lysinibacillus fusiformis]|uniref:hypothetical protein n=1 Tax=Lysinibacillus fusiformis TaxID=28031 RepID=UPI00263B0025|nr:hypothetical protein [Lysinibacillus fusiformis]MDC6267255.1 hypothetical protein [Lysinibacillus sphaericus]MDN4968311.1 hypothetical protein [Lysinibacillus fusiformis]MDN4968485.1 hypothetical protein [Lysinibacillus fusiformis]